MIIELFRSHSGFIKFLLHQRKGKWQRTQQPGLPGRTLNAAAQHNAAVSMMAYIFPPAHSITHRLSYVFLRGDGWLWLYSRA